MSSVDFKTSGELSDEQLVELIKSGKSEYFAPLFKRHIKFISYIVKKYAPKQETEDALSEGFLSFFKAVRLYSPDKGASFKTFFTLTVQSDMRDLNKKTMSKRRIPGELLSSIEDEELPGNETPESLFIIKESVNSFFDNARSLLSDFEYAVFCGRAFGKSYSEIAKETGRSEKAVSAALARAKNKIKSNKG